MNACPDCGCRTDRDICSNCQEELFIIENQAEYIDRPLSDEFTNKAKEQRTYLKKQEEIKRTI
jgi:hypothetical protein